jgi:Asp-tRNA(Asn)/Glu-tRNA(Gln) amidotransferase C subunit
LSTSSPETAVEEDAPKYSADDLKDQNKLDKAMEDFDVVEIEAMSSTEIDSKLDQALRDGLLKRDPGEDIRLDDTFGGVEVVPAIPNGELENLLATMKHRKLEVLRKENAHQIEAELKPLKVPDQRVGHMAFLAEQAYRTGNLALVETRPAIPGKPFQKAQGNRPEQRAVPPIPAEYGIGASDRKQLAVLQAFQSEVSKLSPEEQAKFTQEINKLSRRKADVDKQEQENREKARSLAEQDRKNREDEARHRLERADNARKDAEAEKEGRDAMAEYENEKGIGRNEETLKKGTKIDNPDQRAIDAGIVSKRSGKLLREVTVTSGEVQEEAQEMDKEFDLKRQIGATEYDKIQGYKETAPNVYAAYETAHENWVKNKKAGLPAGREPKIDEYKDHGPNGTKSRTADKETAHGEAIAQAQNMDQNIFQQSEVHRMYQEQIDAEPEVEAKKLLAEARDVAVQEEKTRQVGLTKEHVDNVIYSMKSVTMMQGHAAAGENRKLTVRNAEQAHEIRRMLDANPFPSMEVKVGGYFDKNKGPKMLESWFAVPGNDRLWLVERYNRKTGELISQTTISTEEGSERTRKNKAIPPRSALEHFAEVRPQDKAEMAKKPGANPDGSQGRLGGLSDKVRLGFGGVGANFEGADGVYGNHFQDQYTRQQNNAIQRNPTNPNNPTPNQIAAGAAHQADYEATQHKAQGRPERGGGYLRWLRNLGGRKPKV